MLGILVRYWDTSKRNMSVIGGKCFFQISKLGQLRLFCNCWERPNLADLLNIKLSNLLMTAMVFLRILLIMSSQPADEAILRLFISLHVSSVVIWTSSTTVQQE